MHKSKSHFVIGDVFRIANRRSVKPHGANIRSLRKHAVVTFLILTLLPGYSAHGLSPGEEFFPEIGDGKTQDYFLSVLVADDGDENKVASDGSVTAVSGGAETIEGKRYVRMQYNTTSNNQTAKNDRSNSTRIELSRRDASGIFVRRKDAVGPEILYIQLPIAPGSHWTSSLFDGTVVNYTVEGVIPFETLYARYPRCLKVTGTAENGALRSIDYYAEFVGKVWGCRFADQKGVWQQRNIVLKNIEGRFARGADDPAPSDLEAGFNELIGMHFDARFIEITNSFKRVRDGESFFVYDVLARTPERIPDHRTGKEVAHVKHEMIAFVKRGAKWYFSEDKE